MNLRRWGLPFILSVAVMVVPLPLLYGSGDMEFAPASSMEPTPVGSMELTPVSSSVSLPFVALKDALPLAVLVGVFDSPCGEPAEGVAFRVSVSGGGEYILSLYKVDQRPMRFLLLDNAEGDETPVWAGVVEVDGTLRVRESMTYRELEAKYPTGCELFTQQDA